MCDFLVYDGEFPRQCDNPDIGCAKGRDRDQSYMTCLEHAKKFARPEFSEWRLILDPDVKEWVIDDLCLHYWSTHANDFNQKVISLRERMDAFNKMLDDWKPESG